MMVLHENAVEAGAQLQALKAYLRITGSGEDALLSELLCSATSLCEQFIGQWLVAREAVEILPSSHCWQRLSVRPVKAIVSIAFLDEAGVGVPLPVDAYAIDIDSTGDGWIRTMTHPDGQTLEVRYRAGIAENVAALPDAIRQGIIRLAADHYGDRLAETATPPAVVSALWRPWRRMRLR